MANIAFVSNAAWNLSNFRRPIIEALLRRGDEVTAVAPQDGFGGSLCELGCRFIPVGMDPQGFSANRDINTLLQFRRIYSTVKPQLVMHFTIKPVIYGTIAARLANIPALNTITGLGTAFISDGFLTRVVESLYRLALPGRPPVVFQNSEDMALFKKKRLVTENPCHVVPGSGIDLGAFAASPLPNGRAVDFLVISRLLRDKGIYEYVDAARQIKKREPSARFRMLGPIGAANRTAIPKPEVDNWVNEGIVEYLGETDDVRPFIENATCVVLPSYREGMPRTLLEAAAMGRPLIATNVTGCREVIDDGANGYLCEPREADDLASKMWEFMALTFRQKQEMGSASRAKAVSQFNVERVVDTYIALIDSELARQH